MGFRQGQSLAVIQVLASGIGTLLLDRHDTMMRFVRIGFFVATLGLVALQVACESTPMRTFRGARHYSAGRFATVSL